MFVCLFFPPFLTVQPLAARHGDTSNWSRPRPAKIITGSRPESFGRDLYYFIARVLLRVLFEENFTFILNVKFANNTPRSKQATTTNNGNKEIDSHARLRSIFDPVCKQTAYAHELVSSGPVLEQFISLYVKRVHARL